MVVHALHTPSAAIEIVRELHSRLRPTMIARGVIPRKQVCQNPVKACGKKKVQRAMSGKKGATQLSRNHAILQRLSLSGTAGANARTLLLRVREVEGEWRQE